MRYGFAGLCFCLAFATLFWGIACDTTGLGGGAGAGDGADGASLQVIDELREACPGQSDAGIRQGITLADDHRHAGVDLPDYLEQINDACAETGDPERCNTCESAIANYVYRNADGAGGGADDWDTSGGDWGTNGGDWGTDGGGDWGTNGGDWGTDGGD